MYVSKEKKLTKINRILIYQLLFITILSLGSYIENLLNG